MGAKPTLADPSLKAARAKEHLESLRRELSAFKKSKPATLTVEDDVEHGLCCIRPECADVPPRLAVIAGDVCYCLRSSLDQLIWCLARLSTEIPENTQFPILDSDNSKGRKRFNEFTAGVPKDAIAIIESLQPYNAGNKAAIKSHFLWRLNLLCNIDKHRRLALHGRLVDYPNMFPPRVIRFVRFDDDGVVRFPLSYKRDVNLTPRPCLKVFFGDYSEELMCDYVDIARICNFVADDVIPGFEKFFH